MDERFDDDSAAHAALDNVRGKLAGHQELARQADVQDLAPQGEGELLELPLFDRLDQESIPGDARAIQKEVGPLICSAALWTNSTAEVSSVISKRAPQDPPRQLFGLRGELTQPGSVGITGRYTRLSRTTPPQAGDHGAWNDGTALNPSPGANSSSLR